MSGYRFPQLVADCHAMLLSLSGRVPDAVIAEARALLVTENLEKLAAIVTAIIVAESVPMADREVGLLAGILAGAGIAPEPLEQVERYDKAPLPDWRFAPAAPEVLRAHGSRIGRCLDLTDPRDLAIGDDMLDTCDRTMIDAVSGATGVLGLWRTWRFPAGGPPGRRVHLIEVADDADPYLLALQAQIALSEQGEADPQVETYTTGTALPPYQRAARAWSSLLWASTPPRPFHRARVYDTVDDAGEPGFNAGHPRIADAASRERILRYLASGTMIRETGALRDDVVDRLRRRVVPWRFATDGTWIWSDALAYYLREHHLAPPADFRRHIEGAGDDAAVPDTVTAFRAMTVLYHDGDT